MNRITLHAAVIFVVAIVAVPVLSATAFAGETAPGGCYSEYMKFGASGRVYAWKAGC